jgi:hypothetical protein
VRSKRYVVLNSYVIKSMAQIWRRSDGKDV